MTRVLLWLDKPAKISRFYLGVIWASYLFALIGWWFKL